MQDVTDLALIIDSSVPIVILETRNEPRALEILTQVAMRKQLGFNCWSITEGMRRAGFSDDLDLPADPEAPKEALKLIKKQIRRRCLPCATFTPI